MLIYVDADWQDQRPPAPSYFRILHLGKVLQDDDTLAREFSASSSVLTITELFLSRSQVRNIYTFCRHATLYHRTPVHPCRCATVG